MTTQSQIPAKWYVPFANGDATRVELPVTTADPTRASQTLGFPPLTMQPPESGGVPPQGEDFNGGMNQVARVAWWVLNAGGWPFDAAFATNSNIGGYPKGATVQSADFQGDWISTADSNTNNPDTGSGTAWVPGFQYGVTALSALTGGTVTPTPAQAAKGSITLAGTLTSALTVVLPTWFKNWTITNNTTGAFVTIVKTAAGSGVTIPQNASPTRVSGDGTNIVQSPENIAAATSSTQAMQLGQATGRLLAVRTFTTNATYTPTTGTNSIIVLVQGAGGGGGGSSTTGAGQHSVGGGGCGGSWAQSYITSGFSGASMTIGIAGGGGAVGAGGGNGTATSFGALLTASGGTGGSTSGLLSSPSVLLGGSAGAVPTTGTIVNAQGIQGAPAIAPNPASGTSVVSGTGGGSYFGGGATPIASGTNAGNSANTFGAGGSGAASIASTSGQTGGAGKGGVIVVWEYA